MNKSYRVVWNHVRNCLMVVSEATKSHGKGGATKAAVVVSTAAAVLALGASEAAATDYVLPSSQYPAYDVTLGLNNGDSLAIATNGSVGGAVPNGVFANGFNTQPLTLGTVSGTPYSISNAGTISGVDRGIFLSRSTLAGGIANAGSIAGGSIAGILISNSSVAGDLVNVGTVQGGAAPAIEINGSEIRGGITNAGLITSISTRLITLVATSISGGIRNEGSLLGALIIRSGTNITGGLSNLGLIAVGGAGYAVEIDSGSTLNGGGFKSEVQRLKV